MSAAGDTKWLYRWEEQTLRPLCARGFFPHSIETLRLWGATVWRLDGGHPNMMPRIFAGPGAPGPKRRSRAVDWGESFSIELSRHERCKAILLHEIAHCRGHWDHGPEFRAKYAQLLINHLDVGEALAMSVL